MKLLDEFYRQTDNVIQKGYPEIAGITTGKFRAHLEPLKTILETLDVPEMDIEQGILPFVIVIKSDLVPTNNAMSLVTRNGKAGITKLYPLEPTDFSTISHVVIPNRHAYLLIDIDRGKTNINLAPNVAMQHIIEADRFPITLDEGIAIMTHYPEFLIKNNCFSLLASRHLGDQRVPAIWINSNKNPNLGWCWNGNPHTWLGSASCKCRLG